MKRRVRFSIAVMLVVFCSTLGMTARALAQEDSKASENLVDVYRLKDSTQINTNPVSANHIGTMLLGLGCVLLFILVLAWISRKLKWTGLVDGNTIKLISILSIGPKEKLIVVDVNGERLFLGATQHAISLLKDLSSSSKIDDDSSDIERDIQANSRFSKTIQSLIASGMNKQDD